jgi:hypothetical protein
MLVEQPLSIFRITGESDAKGTSDVVLLPPPRDLTTPVHVGDLKFGRGMVPAKNNYQGAMYIAGVIEKFKVSHGFVYNKTVLEFGIYQPKLSLTPDIWTIPWNELDADFLIPLQRSAWIIINDIKTRHTALHYLNPGEKQCEWCPAGRAGLCPALKKEVYAVSNTIAAADAFGDASQSPLTSTGLAESVNVKDLSGILNKADMIRSFLDACEDRALRELQSGVDVPGYKVVKGDPGKRAWSDENLLTTTIAQIAENNTVLEISNCFETSVKSPTQMEKALKKLPDVWHALVPLIKRADGKEKLAPVSDPRPAISNLQFEDASATLDQSVRGIDLL